MVSIQANDIKLKINDHLVKVGSQAPSFNLIDKDFNEVSLRDCKDMPVLIVSYPSIDAKVCYDTIKVFIKRLKEIHKLVIIGVSTDLPFAIQRANIKENESDTTPTILLSDYQTRQFAQDYGLAIVEGPLVGLLSSAIIVLDKSHKVVYTQRVKDITEEPDYEKAIATIQSLTP